MWGGASRLVRSNGTRRKAKSIAIERRAILTEVITVSPAAKHAEAVPIAKKMRSEVRCRAASHNPLLSLHAELASLHLASHTYDRTAHTHTRDLSA